MKASAIDNAYLSGKEAMRQSSAGRRLTRGTGATSTGGSNRVRDLGISNTLALKSNALRDIAINNAILKRQEQQSAISGLQGFLNSERGEAWNKSGLNERAFAYNQSINDYNHAVSVAKRKGWINLGEQAAIMGLNAYMPGLGTATSGATGLGK